MWDKINKQSEILLNQCLEKISHRIANEIIMRFDEANSKNK